MILIRLEYLFILITYFINYNLIHKNFHVLKNFYNAYQIRKSFADKYFYYKASCDNPMLTIFIIYELKNYNMKNSVNRLVDLRYH